MKSGFLGLKCWFVLTATRDMISQKFKLWQSKNALRKLVVPRSRWKSVSTLASFPKISKYKVKTRRLRKASFNDLKNPLKFPGSIICCRCFIYISSTKKMIFNSGEFQKLKEHLVLLAEIKVFGNFFKTQNYFFEIKPLFFSI